MLNENSKKKNLREKNFLIDLSFINHHAEFPIFFLMIEISKKISQIFFNDKNHFDDRDLWDFYATWFS